MKDINHTKLMLKIAWRDFRTLEGMKEDKKFFADEVFGFHAQQAVEKILKSYLSYNGISYTKTHDLENLINLLKDNNIDLSNKFLELIDLTDFAVGYRYDVEFHDEINREDIFIKVKELFDFVQQRVKS